MIGNHINCSNELKELLEKAKHHIMTPEERAEQQISFAFGNVAIENPSLTKESVRRIYEEMQRASTTN